MRMRTRERGAALVTAMCLGVIVLMIGVSAARAAFNAEKSAQLERDRLVAFGAAEAALLDAERDIEAGSRTALIDSGGAFAEGCGSAGVAHGLCAAAKMHDPPAWQAADLDDAAFSAALGEFTGSALATAAPGQPLQLPRYIIEPVPLPPAAAPAALFRITAIGFGTRAGTRVVLQAVHHKPGAAPPHGPPLPAGRISWREIANWPELHAAAIR